MHRTSRYTAAFAALALASAGAVATAGGATAAVAAKTTLAGGLVSPLTAAITSAGNAYVSENFAGTLVKIRPGHKPKPVYQANKGVELGAVSFRRGVVTFGLTTKAGGLIKQMDKAGNVTTLANVGSYEKNHNPDAHVIYGFRDITPDCESQLPKGFPAKYNGIVETHPYATASDADATYVADAAANAILKIEGGRVSTVAVLPAVPIEITADVAKAQGLPDCVAGLTYWFEPVPTDVEVSHGQLYVSALTGGPEDGSLGPQGRVYTIDPTSGHPDLLASGFAGAVGVAVNPTGDVFVSQLFGGQISKIPAGSSTPVKYRSANMPAAVEWARDTLYATTNVLSDPPAGKLVRFGG